MPTINDLRQQAATIKNATQVGENTATRVGTTFETIADLLEGMGGVTNLSTIDIGSIDTLNTTGDMLVGTPNIYTLTKTIGANTFKVGTLFQFANNGRYDVAQVIVSQFIVDSDGRIDTTSADQEVHIFYRLCKTMNGGSLPTPIGTWTTWTELGGSGGSGVTIDPYPTQNSGNAVSSGGVFERLQDIAPKVDISAIDDIDEYTDMLATKSPFYVVTKTLSGNVFRIGTLMEFSNQGRYILYQILATDYVLNDDGTLDTTLSENGGLKLIWRMKQFSGNPPAGVTIGEWSAWTKFGDSGYQPDNEDIDLNANDQLQFANKAYDASAFSGLGRIYLRKNIVTSGGVEKNVLTQAMMNTVNTIYHIQYDYDLNGQTITLPANVTLQFEGGSFANGAITGNHTKITSENTCFKNTLNIGGTWDAEIVYSKWFSFVSTDDGTTDNVDVFKQLQSFVNGTEGCKLEMKKGYYQTSVKWNTPDEMYEGVPKWRTNVYARDEMVVLNIVDLPYFELNMNKATIKIIDNPTPFYYVISFVNIKNGSIHDGTIIGCARGYSYAEYYNYNNVLTQNYEMITGVYQAGGFIDVYNFEITEIQGDAFALGSAWWKYDGDQSATEMSSNGYLLHDCVVSYCGRNGVTLHSSEMGNLSNVHIHHIGSDAGNYEIGTDGIMGFNPRSGIDVEFEDGVGLEPIMIWEGLRINNCNRKSFSFAQASQSRMKEFHAFNLYVEGDCPTNNLTAKIATFDACYIKQMSDWPSFYGNGSNIVFTDCVFGIVSNISDFGCNFVRCTFNDNRVETGGYLNENGVNVGTFDDCVFNIKNMLYLKNKRFTNCKFNISGILPLPCAYSTFKRCSFFDVSETQGTYTYSLNMLGSADGTLVLDSCYFQRALGVGGAVSQYFLYAEYDTQKISVKNCEFDGACYMCVKKGVINISESTFNNDFYVLCYTTDRAEQIIISKCQIKNFWVTNGTAYNAISIYDSNIGAEKYFTKVSLYNSVVDIKNTTGADAAQYVGNIYENCIVNFVTAITNNAQIYMIGCVVKGGITEANFLGTAKGCTFETPLPTSGTTAQRPSASVAGVGFKFFDTDLDKPVYSDGTSWLDGTGAPSAKSLVVLSISQSDYDALVTKDPNTLYVIV